MAPRVLFFCVLVGVDSNSNSILILILIQYILDTAHSTQHVTCRRCQSSSICQAPALPLLDRHQVDRLPPEEGQVVHRDGAGVAVPSAVPPPPEVLGVLVVVAVVIVHPPPERARDKILTSV